MSVCAEGVGIYDDDLASKSGEVESEIRSEYRLAHPTLGAGDCDNLPLSAAIIGARRGATGGTGRCFRRCRHTPCALPGSAPSSNSTPSTSEVTQPGRALVDKDV